MRPRLNAARLARARQPRDDCLLLHTGAGLERVIVLLRREMPVFRGAQVEHAFNGLVRKIVRYRRGNCGVVLLDVACKDHADRHAAHWSRPGVVLPVVRVQRTVGRLGAPDGFARADSVLRAR